MTETSKTNPSNCRGLILVIDGDNTLWDTNSVFESAQHWLIKSLNRAGPGVSTGLSFKKLRRVDDILVRRTGRQEYNFQLLILTLLHLQKGVGETDAVSIAISELREHSKSSDAEKAAKLSKAFRVRLKKIPPLLPCVSSSLDELSQLKTCHKNRLAIVLLSEGTRARLKPILERYINGKKVFDVQNIVERKSTDTLLRAKVVGSKVIEHQLCCSSIQNELIVIGDSIKSDIEPGNSIGAITIYIPGRYRGAEEPTKDSERPKIVLKTFCDVPMLVARMLASLA